MLSQEHQVVGQVLRAMHIHVPGFAGSKPDLSAVEVLGRHEVGDHAALHHIDEHIVFAQLDGLPVVLKLSHALRADHDHAVILYIHATLGKQTVRRELTDAFNHHEIVAVIDSPCTFTSSRFQGN